MHPPRHRGGRISRSSARMWDEAKHEVSRRLGVRVRDGMPQEIADRFWDAAVRLTKESIAEVPEELYEELRDEALSRLPRDPNDWQAVALALSLGGEDFFGCGVATWTADTLISQLERRGYGPLYLSKASSRASLAS